MQTSQSLSLHYDIASVHNMSIKSAKFGSNSRLKGLKKETLSAENWTTLVWYNVFINEDKKFTEIEIQHEGAIELIDRYAKW